MDTNNSLFFLPKFCGLKPLFMLVIGAELLAIVLIVATGDILSESWDELGLLSIFVQWIALASACSVCLCRRWLEKLPLLWSSTIAYMIVMLVTGVIASVAEQFLERFGYQPGNSAEFIPQFIVRCLIISAIISAVAFRYFYMQQQWQERIELETQARVQALQSRIKPHFLFNSMNIIASLIPTRPQLAEQAVEDLSELFRATLKETGSFVALSEEQALSEHYVRIEKLRLGRRLEVVWSLGDIPKDAAVPMLTLQPLMENAIYHGIQPLPEGGVVTVSGEFDGLNVKIKVHNPLFSGVAEGLKKHSGNRLALDNIKHRLYLLFGPDGNLTANPGKESYEVILEFPYKKITELR